MGIWTWDFRDQRTPPQNEIFEVGRDEYGPILQFDRGDYGANGDADKIGLLPRMAGDWNRKDGDDKFWKPELGQDVYLVGGENQVWAKPPDISLRVVGASVEAPERIVIAMSGLVNAGDVTTNKITITEDGRDKQMPVAANLLLRNGKTKANEVELVVGTPLDIVRHTYDVNVDGFGGNVRALPRAILSDTNLFYDGDAVLGATYTKESTTFRVFAPTARAVQVVIYDEPTGNNGRMAHPMKALGKGVWEGKASGDLEGKFYLYKPEGEGFVPDREALDIYCINAVNSSQRARITDLAKTNPPGLGQGKGESGAALGSPGGHGGVRDACAGFHDRSEFRRGAQGEVSGVHRDGDAFTGGFFRQDGVG